MRVLEVFPAPLGLGLTSFSGPLAHPGYLHQALIRHRGWFEVAYAHGPSPAHQLPAPGPTG